MNELQLQQPPVEQKSGHDRRLRPEIQTIISRGQVAEGACVSLKAVSALTGLTGLLLWLGFAPVECAPVAWVALVPLCQLIRLRSLPRRVYLAVTGVTFLWSLVMLQWMRLGHWTMHFALLALALYVSLYMPVFLAVSRRIVSRGVPMWVAVPLVWTALEYARAYLLTGFSWYYLGHTQYRWLSLIQVSDLTGAYGVSFLVAAGSAVLAGLIPIAWLTKLRITRDPHDVFPGEQHAARLPAIAVVMMVMVACVYGIVRQQPDAKTAEGPIVAIVQGNFSPEVKHDDDQTPRMIREHDLLMVEASKFRPDLIVLPETMFPRADFVVAEGVSDADLIARLPPESGAGNAQLAAKTVERWRDGWTRELLHNRSQELGPAVMFGVQTLEVTADGLKKYNSAAFVRPDLGYVGRYDKMHRVLFGEYIPLKAVFPWLARLVPFGAGFGIDAGQQKQVYEYAGTRFAPVICFEDTVPQLVRNVVLPDEANPVAPDVLLNLTNDGWFRGSSELDQHLITAVFRCVETRRPMIRAVNTGISAFIDSSGRIRQPEHYLVMDEESAALNAEFTRVDSMYDEETGSRRRQCSAVLCGQVPLDSRNTLYLMWGDWFPILCSAIVLVGVVYSGRKTKETP